MGELENLRAEVDSLKVNMTQAQHRLRDCEKRFDTLQSWWFKRVWWWVQGWPWLDLNAEKKKWRPWNCEKCRRREKRIIAAVTGRPCGGCGGD